MGICAETLGPGIAAYHRLADAGRLCELAGFDGVIAQLCRTGAGEIGAQALLPVDKKVLCAVFCCCKVSPEPSEQGRGGYDTCATQTLHAADEAQGGRGRYKAQVSYNMRAPRPEPLMDTANPTTPIPWDPGGITRIGRRIERDFPDVEPFGGTDTRRPDAVIVRDPTQPPTVGNIARVVDFKFTDSLSRAQELTYQRIGNGRPPLVINDEECDCEPDRGPRTPVPVLVEAESRARVRTEAAQRAAEYSTGARVALGAAALLLGAGAVALAFVPFDGPFGEMALGGAAASAGAIALGVNMSSSETPDL